jgi:hypothetical protein
MEPWSPRWVREKLREYKNDLPPNDLNHDDKQPSGVEHMAGGIGVVSCPFLRSIGVGRKRSQGR